jgi:hypothetical protein
MQKVRLIATPGLVLFAFPAFAHGEEVLIFPMTFLILLVPALLIAVLPWHRWWIRLGVAALLPATNLVLWFSPPIPHTIGAFAAYDFRKAFAILLLGPVSVAAIAIFVCRKLIARTGTGPGHNSL